MKKLFSLLFIILITSCSTYGKKEHCKEYNVKNQECEDSWQEYLEERRMLMMERPFVDRR